MVRQSMHVMVSNSHILFGIQVDKEGGVGMEDAAGFFANVFGGERFNDYVRGPPLCSNQRTKNPVDRRDFAHEGDDFCCVGNDDRRGEGRDGT